MYRQYLLGGQWVPVARRKLITGLHVHLRVDCKQPGRPVAEFRNPKL